MNKFDCPTLGPHSFTQQIIAKAIIVDEAGRYLMQLRDDIPTIALPAHWGLFGGAADKDETPSLALQRELEEELGFRPILFEWFTEALFVLPAPALGVVHGIWFVVPVSAAQVRSMVLQEGEAMALLSLPEILGLEKVSPWDLAATLAHGRRRELFGNTRATT